MYKELEGHRMAKVEGGTREREGKWEMEREGEGGSKGEREGREGRGKGGREQGREEGGHSTVHLYH